MIDNSAVKSRVCKDNRDKLFVTGMTEYGERGYCIFSFLNTEMINLCRTIKIFDNNDYVVDRRLNEKIGKSSNMSICAEYLEPVTIEEFCDLYEQDLKKHIFRLKQMEHCRLSILETEAGDLALRYQDVRTGRKYIHILSSPDVQSIAPVQLLLCASENMLDYPGAVSNSRIIDFSKIRKENEYREISIAELKENVRKWALDKFDFKDK